VGARTSAALPKESERLSDPAQFSKYSVDICSKSWLNVAAAKSLYKIDIVSDPNAKFMNVEQVSAPSSAPIRAEHQHVKEEAYEPAV
jgi:hypothetical protein